MRHEKHLLALPVPACPDIRQPKDEQIDRYKTRKHRRFHAEIVTLKGEDVLAVTTFDTQGKATYRFFQMRDCYGMQVFATEQIDYRHTRKPGKCYGAAIDSVYTSLNSYWYSSTELKMHGVPDSDEAIRRWFGAGKTKDPIHLLAEKQQAIRQERINARDDRERDRLRRAFIGVNKEIPAEFKQFAEEVALRPCRYFFYDYTGKKQQSGVCSHCMQRAELPGVREFEKGTCPHCGTEFTFYSAKRLSRSHGISHHSYAAFCVPVSENRTAVRCCSVSISLRGGMAGKPIEKSVWAYERIRVFLDGSGHEKELYTNPEGTKKVSVDNLCACNWMNCDRECYIAPMHLEEIRERMGIYAPLERLAEHGLCTTPGRLFTASAKDPRIEYLIKLGFYGLAQNEISGERKAVLLQGKRVHEVLGVDADVIPLLKEADPTAGAFLVIRQLLGNGVRLTVRDMRDIDRLKLDWRSAVTLLEMAAGVSIHKALTYIERQAAIYKSGGAHVLQEWSDYCRMARAIGIDLGDHCARLPKNLKAAHLEASKIQKFKKNERINRRNERINRRMAATARKLEDLCWSFDGLTIRPAVDHAELFEEGKALSHCVGRMGYAEKQAAGETAIFFIRKAKTPEESYVTLELDLKDWETLQCYGSHDTYPGPKVNAFVKKWIDEVVRPRRVTGEKKKKGDKTA